MLIPCRLIFLICTAGFFSCENKIDNNSMSNKNIDTFETAVQIPIKLHYVLYTPDNYHNADAEFPLVLYLHGKGERGEDLTKLELNGIPELISKGNK